jgi:hypothetical protein
MDKIKEMPYEEKYSIVMDNIKDTFALDFVTNNIGKDAAVKLKIIWSKGIKPIKENASPKEKYEAAYGNWIRKSKSTLQFIRKRLGEEGLERFKMAEAKALIRKNSGPAMILLNVVRAISPDSAFKMIAEKMSYQFQWITPFTVSEINKHRAIIDIPSCKILDYPDTDDICRVGCQGAYPMWVAKQFKTNMVFERQGNSCTCTLTQLR